MCAGNLFGDSGERLVNLAVILECIFAENYDMIFFTVPFTDELLATFKGVFVEGLLNLVLNPPIDVVLRAHRKSALFFLLHKIGDLADDNINALWPMSAFENFRPQLL